MYRLYDWEKRLRPRIGRNDNTITKMSENYPKDSFNRFGDDLVRLLLSYCSSDESNDTFEDRCLHECVSKQFQRVLFDTINDMYIDGDVIIQFRSKESANESLSDKELCRKLIAFLQKKCPNIQKVSYFDHNFDMPYIRPVFEAIHELRTNWPYLKTIANNYEGMICDYGLDNQFIEYLTHNFGPMITEYDCNSENPSLYLSNCPNLSYLSLPSLQSMFTTEEDNQLLEFHRMKDIFFDRMKSDINMNAFKVFVSYYKTRLQSLAINFNNTFIGSQLMVTQIIATFSEFQELKDIHISLSFGITFQYSLYDSLKAIGMKCLTLKKLLLSVKSKNTALNIKIINAIQYMPRLKHLDLSLSAINVEVITDWTQLKPLNGWPQLTHLSLQLWSSELINQIVSKQYKLQHLSITCDDNGIIDNNRLECISRQSSLESLHITDVKEFRFKESNLKQLLAKCPKLRHLNMIKSQPGSSIRFDSNGLDIPQDIQLIPE